MNYLLVFLGGGLGSTLRLAVNRAAIATLGHDFPFGTFIVNVVGSYLMGLLAAFLLTGDIGDHPLRLFLTTGILGGFTTFSAFSLDAAIMWQRGEWASFTVYIVGSVLCSILALFFGFATTGVVS